MASITPNILTVLSLVAVLAGTAGAGGAPSRVEQRPPAGPGVVARMDWLFDFVVVMQDVLWLMGGDAQGIDCSAPDPAMRGFRARCSELGVPQNLSESARQRLRAALDRLDLLLADAPNTASDEEIRLTQNTIAQLRPAVAVGSSGRFSP